MVSSHTLNDMFTKKCRGERVPSVCPSRLRRIGPHLHSLCVAAMRLQSFRERERERERETDRQTDRQTERETDRQTDRQTDRETDRQTDRQRQTDRKRDRDRR